jgi:transcriptional regulator with XRE-family HTH domain
MGTIGQALTKMRFERGLTGTAVSKAINLTSATYSKIERDQREISFIMMYRVCRFYEISLYEFADMISAKELERSDYTIIRLQEKKKAKAAMVNRQ